VKRKKENNFKSISTENSVKIFFSLKLFGHK